MRAVITVAIFAGFALAVGNAAASPTARLVYVRRAGAERCPSESELRDAVAQRLGYDPFFSTAEKIVISQFSREKSGYRARVQLLGDDGSLRGERELSTPGDDCPKLMLAVALAVSLALDDLDDARPEVRADAPAEAPEPPREVLPASVAEPAIPSSKEPVVSNNLQSANNASLPQFAGAAGPTASVGTGPSFAPGGSVSLVVRWPRIAARIDGHGELPAQQALADGGTLYTRAAFATCALCIRFGVPFVCSGGGAGAVWTSTKGVSREATDRGALAVAFLRLGGEVPLGSRVYFEPYVDVGAHALRPSVDVGGRAVYQTPVAWGSAGILVGSRIF